MLGGGIAPPPSIRVGVARAPTAPRFPRLWIGYQTSRGLQSQQLLHAIHVMMSDLGDFKAAEVTRNFTSTSTKTEWFVACETSRPSKKISQEFFDYLLSYQQNL